MKTAPKPQTTQLFVLALSLAALSVACGPSFATPTDRLATAEAVARTAHELDAESEPRAALYLKLANEEIDKAKAAMKNEENKSADLLLQRAAADAELSIQVAKSAKAKADAQAAQDRAAALRGK